MSHVDFIPTFQDAKEMRAHGYTGAAQLDKVLRWFREEQNIHINPIYNNGVYHVQVIAGGNDIPMGRLKKACYYGAAWAGVQRAKFYINNHHRDEQTKHKYLVA